MAKKNNVDTNINIQDDKCWRCGKKLTDDRTTHHAIPKSLSPKRNVLIPLCNRCHNELHNVDHSVLRNYVYKIKCDCTELSNNIKRVSSMIEHIIEMQDKLDKAVENKE